MKKILLTGASGFVGSNVLKYLKEFSDYQIDFPSRGELDLKNESMVVSLLKRFRYDVIIHFASPTPLKNEKDNYSSLLEDSMRIFLNLYNHSDLYGKMIYTGSGAEYDKSIDIDRIREEESFRSVPFDSYGIAKMIMNSLAESSKNVYNYRIFGCFGPGDHESKFITHCIRSVLLNMPITIRKDCEFDYIHVLDFARYVKWGIDNDMCYHSYNIASGIPTLLSDIAKIVLELMDSDLPIDILSNDRNNNYSANNSRIVDESGVVCKYSLEMGIREQIAWEREHWSPHTKFDGV